MTRAIKNFERYCRLCAEEQEVTVKLFSKEAADMILLEKLKRYLQIEVDENDKFPKNICINCCTKLETLCHFIELVRKAQKSLQVLSTIIENNDSYMIDTIKEETTEITEVCIDPMDILNMSDETDSEQIRYPCTDELVTLKLIAKNDNNQVETEKGKPIKKKFSCGVCNKSFSVEQSLKNHSWTHIQDEEYSCFRCQRSFKYQYDLNKHKKSHNPLGLNYNCHVCGRRFKLNDTYESHMLLHEASKKSYTCDICGRSYSNWAGLKIHMITHSTEKPFDCSLCDKKFKRNQELKFHMNHHTGDKPYKCKYCDKSFASTGNLYSHTTRTHTNNSNTQNDKTETEKQKTENAEEGIIISNETIKSYKYQCYFCKKGCARHENYLYHMFQHTGIKPFKCTECTHKFITQRTLSSHYDKVHPNINKPTMPMPSFCPKKKMWITS